VRADIASGGTFPDYELTDHTKTRHKLSELQGNDPMVLVLSRLTVPRRATSATSPPRVVDES
jgi:peroxiredoxin